MLVQFFIIFPFERDIACSVLGQNFVVCFSRESADAKQQDVEDEPQTEHITNGVVFSLHVLNVNDFRSHVPRGTTPHEQILLSIRKLSQTKVSYHALPTVLRTENQIFWL